MKVNNIYPEIKEKNLAYPKIRPYVRIAFLIAAVTCVVVNLATGGKAWSIIVVWSLFGVWKLLFSPDTVEFNIISQAVKVMFYTVILLGLIDYFLAPGWAEFVIPIVCFGTLIFTCIVFFTDIRNQMKNTLPMIRVVSWSLIAGIVYAMVRRQMDWTMIVLIAVSSAILIFFLLFPTSFLRELHKRFHTH